MTISIKLGVGELGSATFEQSEYGTISELEAKVTQTVKERLERLPKDPSVVALLDRIDSGEKYAIISAGKRVTDDTFDYFKANAGKDGGAAAVLKRLS